MAPVVYLTLFLLCFSTRVFGQDVRAIEIPIMDGHVGKDEERHDTFVYEAPAGYDILDYKVVEHRKGGDASYTSRKDGPNRITATWRIKSHTVRGPFKTVLDTKTAFLTLGLQLQLRRLPAAAPLPSPPVETTEAPLANNKEINGILDTTDSFFAGIRQLFPKPFDSLPTILIVWVLLPIWLLRATVNSIIWLVESSRKLAKYAKTRRKPKKA